jgi:hypothetical protein
MPQCCPQPPQLAGSRLVWTQLCPHWVVPPPQLVAQAPCEQTSPEAQTLPQPPQLAGSTDVIAQLPPHIDCPVGHAAVESVWTSAVASAPPSSLLVRVFWLPPQPWAFHPSPQTALASAMLRPSGHQPRVSRHNFCIELISEGPSRRGRFGARTDEVLRNGQSRRSHMASG